MKHAWSLRKYGTNNIDGILVDIFDVLLPDDSPEITGGILQDLEDHDEAVRRAEEAGTTVFNKNSKEYQEGRDGE